jgi:flagellar hook-associated protein 1 FlgK
MSLLGALQVGKSAILTNQAAIQVIGNNIANASNTTYTRQRAELSALYGSTDYGDGVELSSVSRIADTALNERLRQSKSDTSYDKTRSDYLSQLENTYNELTDVDLSTGLTDFFGSFSTLASTPSDTVARNTVLDEGQSLVSQIHTLRQAIIDLNDTLVNSMKEAVDGINSITEQLASLNVQIGTAVSTGNTASALLDKRDTLLGQLSELTDITVSEQDNGSVIVYIGSDPVVQNNQSRQLKVETEVNGSTFNPVIRFADDNKQVRIEGGKVGSINDLIHEDIDGNLDDLDTLISSLIYEVNKLHSSGQGLVGYDSTTSTNKVSDPNAVLSQAGLKFTPQNGSFKITIINSSTGETVNTKTINIDLNGLGGNDLSLNNLAALIDDVDYINATVTSDGRLTISSDSDDYTFCFSEDTSNILTSLGINCFFVGTDAGDIAVNPNLINNPKLLACSQSGIGSTGDGKNATAIAKLTSTPSAILNGESITSYYESMVGSLGSEVASASQQYEIHSAISESLQSQWDSLCGVNVDEETIDMMSYQRGFQGAAKFISTIDQLLDEIMQIF